MSSNHERAARYRWLSEGWPRGLGEAGCLTVVASGEPDAVLDVFRADTTRPRPLTEAVFAEEPHVALLPATGGVAAIESGGYEGSRDAVLRDLSRGGKAASVSWEVNGAVFVSRAARGRVRLPVDLSVEDEATNLLRSLRLPGDQPDLVALGALAVARYTGVSIVEAPALEATPAYPIEPRPEKLPVEHLEGSALSYEYPSLAHEIVAADSQIRRGSAKWSAFQGLAVVGLVTEPRLRGVVAQLVESSGIVQQSGALKALAAQVRREERQTERRFAALEGEAPRPDTWQQQDRELQQSRADLQRAIQRTWAIQAVEYACQTDVTSAALGAAAAGVRCFAAVGLDGEFASEVSRRLGEPVESWPWTLGWISQYRALP